MEFTVSFFTILAFIIYYSYFRVEKQDEYQPTVEKFYDKLPRRSKKSLKNANKKNDYIVNTQDLKEKRKRVINPQETVIVRNVKEILLTSFKEGKDLISVHIQNEGRLILTSDDKRINLFVLNSLHEKNPKSYTKKIDNDSITDASVCGEKIQVAVGLKNAKEIIFYEIQKNNQDNKLRLQKIEKKVLKSDQKYEVRKVLFTRDGSYLATSGVIQDTKIHIYNGTTLQKLASIDINKIENIDLKFSKDEKFLTTSTYMYELGIIEFNLTMKFNKNNKTEEKILRLEKKKSISNIKYPIISYDFSNESNFFVLSADDKKIKIFQSYENLEDAKIMKEIDIEFEDENILPKAENVTLYVLEARKNEFYGIIACSFESNIFIFSSNGNLLKYIPKAHDDDIIKLKILKDNDSVDPNGLALISVSKDGKVNIMKIN